MKQILLSLLICFVCAGLVHAEEIAVAAGHVETAEAINQAEICTDAEQEITLTPLSSNPPVQACTFGQSSLQQCQSWGQAYCDGNPTICVCQQWSFGPGGFQCTGGGRCDCA